MASRLSGRAGREPARAIKPHADKAAALLKALANEQRLMIVCNLLEGPLSVGELNDRLTLSQSALSQHLGVLREANIVATTREAQSIRYALSSGAVTRIIEILYREFCEAESSIEPFELPQVRLRGLPPLDGNCGRMRSSATKNLRPWASSWASVGWSSASTARIREATSGRNL